MNGSDPKALNYSMLPGRATPSLTPGGFLSQIQFVLPQIPVNGRQALADNRNFWNSVLANIH